MKPLRMAFGPKKRRFARGIRKRTQGIPGPLLRFLTQARRRAFCLVRELEVPTSNRQMAMAGAKNPFGVSLAPLMNPATNSFMTDLLLDCLVGWEDCSPHSEHDVSIDRCRLPQCTRSRAPRIAGVAGRRIGSRTVLDGFPALADTARVARGHARPLSS